MRRLSRLPITLAALAFMAISSPAGARADVLLAQVEIAAPTLVAFAPGAAAVTPEARAQVEKIARAWKRNNVRSVKVVGHADPTMAQASAMELSKARAKAIEAEFVRNGIRAQYVSTHWRGGVDPRIRNGQLPADTVEITLEW